MGIDSFQREFIADIKEKVRAAQYEALKSVNLKLITLYWEIGKSVAEKQSESWGKAIVPALSRELQKEFPKTGGFSTTNIWYMVQLYTDYQKDINLQPLVGEISWSKHVVILSKSKNSLERQFYILSTKKFGWTKNVLINQIENKTYERFLLNQTTFQQPITTNIDELAQSVIKDSYTFDFLNLADKHSENELEQGLIKNVKSFYWKWDTTIPLWVVNIGFKSATVIIGLIYSFIIASSNP